MSSEVCGIFLGRTYEDVVTGFCGVAVGVAQYMTGCHQVFLVGRLRVGDTYSPTMWIDVDRAKLQGDVPIVTLQQTHNGCDRTPSMR